MNWQGIVDYVLLRLTERSTYAGIVGLLTAAGITIKPELAEAIGATGAAVAGLLLVVTGDKKPIQVEVKPVINMTVKDPASQETFEAVKKSLIEAVPTAEKTFVR